MIISVTTHLMMIDTDYETYASYIECNAEDGYDIPIVQSLGSAEIDPVLLARYIKNVLQDNQFDKHCNTFNYHIAVSSINSRSSGRAWTSSPRSDTTTSALMNSES